MPVPSQGHCVFTVFQLLTDFVCLYTYEFLLSLCKIVRSSVSEVNVKDTFTSHIDNKIFLTFLLTPYLYTFSLYENSSFIIFSAETEYCSTRSWYRNINFLKNSKFTHMHYNLINDIFKY
jgi:hypothetical protein